MERFTSGTVDTFVELRSVRLSGSTDRFVGGLVDDFDALAESQRAQRFGNCPSGCAVGAAVRLARRAGAVVAGEQRHRRHRDRRRPRPRRRDDQPVPRTGATIPVASEQPHAGARRGAQGRRGPPAPNEVDRGTPDMGWTATAPSSCGMRRFVTVVARTRSPTCPSASSPERSSPSSVRPDQGRRPSPTSCAASTTPTAVTSHRRSLPCRHDSADWRRQSQRCSRTAASCNAACATTWRCCRTCPTTSCCDHSQVTDADAFVRRLRHGLQSQVSLGGDNFSAGQGQRLALARAVVRDAPILVLDEATCNLDSHTERKVMDSILEQRRGRTTLLFGHRLSALDRASRIVVLAGGDRRDRNARRARRTRR